MSVIWNFTNPLRTGSLKLATSGRELYGTVVKAGVNKKTVTVKVNRFYYVQKYKKTYSRTGTFQVHDEDEFCVLGDKVVIQTCRPMSKTKRYFVRNVVVMAGRTFDSPDAKMKETGFREDVLKRPETEKVLKIEQRNQIKIDKVEKNENDEK